MIYCTAASTSFSDSVSCITFLFSEWHINLIGLEKFKGDAALSLSIFETLMANIFFNYVKLLDKHRTLFPAVAN